MQNPVWFTQLLNQFQAGIAHAFILHLNTADYVCPGVRLQQYLFEALAKRDIIVCYDRSRGITFPLGAMEEKARRLLQPAQPQAPTNSALAALLETAAPTQAPDWPRDPGAALETLEEIMRATDPETGEQPTVTLILDFAEMVAPAADKATMPPADRTTLTTLLRWGNDPGLSMAGQMVILIVRNLSDLHPDVRAASAKYEAIELPLPGLAQRREYIDWYIEQSGIDMDGVTPDVLANMTAGLSLVHIEDIFLNAQAAGGLDLQMVADRKSSIIRSEFGDVLETPDNCETFADIGGMERLKEFFRRRVIRPLREGDARRAPMGILCTGPAGTGKTILARAVASEAGVNFVTLRIGGQIASKWQGEGERNLEKALAAIDSLTPAIVFIDEIDQAVQRGNGGGGNQQDQRIFQRLLDYMSDTRHRGKVCFLAATNRPDLMDAALKRPGRFDKKIPFLVPDRDERAQIVKVMARKYMRVEIEGDLVAVLDQTEGWTGAELEAAAIKADELLYDEVVSSPLEALAEATRRLSPSTADIEFMTMLAIQECNDLDLLPPAHQRQAQNRQELEQKIEQMRPAIRKQRTL